MATRGRPRIDPESVAKYEVAVRMNHQMHRALGNIARGLGMSSAGYLRTLLYSHINQIHARADKIDG